MVFLCDLELFWGFLVAFKVLPVVNDAHDGQALLKDEIFWLR